MKTIVCVNTWNKYWSPICLIFCRYDDMDLAITTAEAMVSETELKVIILYYCVSFCNHFTPSSSVNLLASIFHFLENPKNLIPIIWYFDADWSTYTAVMVFYIYIFSLAKLSPRNDWIMHLKQTWFWSLRNVFILVMIIT